MAEAPQGGLKPISRMQLFELICQKGEFDLQYEEGNRNLCCYVIKELGLQNPSQEVQKIVGRVISRFSSEFSSKWEKSSRKMERFLQNNEDWLQKTLSFPDGFKKALSSVSSPTPQRQAIQGPSRGRPEKDFSDSSDKTKKRKVETLVHSVSEEEITFAAQQSLRSSGKRNAAEIVKEATQTTPHRATKIKKAYLSSQKSTEPIPYTPEEALSLIVDSKLTKHQYLMIRLQAKERRADIYPSYHIIRESKEKCYPAQESVTITDTVAEVKLQSLLDLTVTRLLKLQDTVLDQVPSDKLDWLTLICKWGCDGSTGQSEYKQKFTTEGDQTITDRDLFVTSLVPIQMYAGNENDKIVIWQNPRPSSTRFCRPIRLQFIKETAEIAKEEVEYIENQISCLLPTKTKRYGNQVVVHHKLVMTMVDGKICNAITSTKSAQLCYICGASPKEMNDLQKVASKPPNISTLSFGLSTLHAWIRFFECLLHISYRLDIKKWQARGTEDQASVKARKQTVVDKFRHQMGLLVDQPKPGGSGTSNDGNTARRFFQNPELSSEITGVNQELIQRFAVILQTISSGFQINNEAFDSYALETAKLFVELYNWFYMPASVHKILIHGSLVIKSSILPIGQLSEEAQEARNKDCKLFRRAHTRKSSRKNTNEDLLHLLLISSDPIISSIRPLQQKHSGPFPSEALALLAQPKNIEDDEPGASFAADELSYLEIDSSSSSCDSE